MEPRVVKRDRKLQLSYELRHRIHSAQIYPITAPNGSTVIIYGHERGLRIVWRGGRRRRKRNADGTRPNGTSTMREVIDTSSDGCEAQQTHHTMEGEFEDEDEELDPDCPYPRMTEEADVDLNLDVLHLAIPVLSTQSSPHVAGLLSAHGVVAVACSDGSQRVLTFPLSPPVSTDIETYINNIRSTQITFPSAGPLCNALAAKIMAADALESGRQSKASCILLVAVMSDILRIHQFSIVDDLTALEQNGSSGMIPLPHAATQLVFHPSSKSAQLLIGDVSGAVRLFDPYGTSISGRLSSPNANDPSSEINESGGRWVFTLSPPYVLGMSSAHRHKHVLDAKWVMEGKAILVLLEDGEWGFWDLVGPPQTGKLINDFAISGYLASGADTTPSSQPKNGTKLAPMTPNTRKAKADALFGTAPKVPGVAPRGGISVSINNNRSHHQDESVVMWYNCDIYTIPNLQAFWQRNTNSSSNSLGSLHSPGLTHVRDINTAHEMITSISQFPSPPSSSNTLGQINTLRDLLVAAEHRCIILQDLRPLPPTQNLFQQAATERPESRDQRMLNSRELDLIGMDRMLDSMAAGDNRPRRVGFAH